MLLLILFFQGRHRWTIDNFVRRASCTEVGDRFGHSRIFILLALFKKSLQGHKGLKDNCLSMLKLLFIFDKYN